MLRKPPPKSPLGLALISNDIANKIYQLMSELFASVANRTHIYHFRLVGTSGDSLSQLLDCDNESAKQIISSCGVFDLENNKFKRIQDNFSLTPVEKKLARRIIGMAHESFGMSIRKPVTRQDSRNSSRQDSNSSSDKLVNRGVKVGNAKLKATLGTLHHQVESFLSPNGVFDQA
jgi:hypothetical protein